MEASLYRYIINRSLRHQLTLTGIIFVATAVSIVPLELQKRIINQAIATGDLPWLLWLCAGFLLAVLVAGGLKYAITNYEGMISETMLRDLRSELYHRLLRFPLPHLRNTSSGQLVAMMIGEVEELGLFFGQALSVPLQHGLTLVVLVGYMAWSNPWMALAGVAIYPVQIWLVPRLQRRVSRMSRDRVRAVRGISDRIHDSVGGIQEVQLNETPAYEARRFRRQLHDLFAIRMRIYNLKYFIKWLNNFLAKLGPFFLFLVGGWFIIERPGSFDLGSLVAFLSAYERLNEPWRELLNYYQQKEVAETKYEQVIASFDPPGLRRPFTLEEAPPPPDLTLRGAYELRQASVVLDGTATVLDRLQLAVGAHEHVAVVGRSGSGKSTLTLLLANLYGYTGNVQVDSMELSALPPGVIGRQLAYVGPEARLFTGTIRDNIVYGLRHRPPAGGGQDGDWLDLTPLGVADRAGLEAAVLEVARTVDLEDDLFAFGLRAAPDLEGRPEIAERVLVARRLVAERFASEGGEAAVEPFDRERFAGYASIGENLLFGYSEAPELALDRLAEHPHFRGVIAEVGLEGPLLGLGAEVAREMVEIFQDIRADDELFQTFSLITAAELPEYARLVTRLERAGPESLPPEDQGRLLRLALRLVPARHRLGRIDPPFVERIVAARHRIAEVLAADPRARFIPYDPDRYFAGGTLLENMLFGKVVATSSLAVKRVNAIVEEVIAQHGMRELVVTVGLDAHVGLLGGRLSPVQRQKVALARALLKRPQVLILDAALAPLDAERRAEMHRRLGEAMKGRTLIAVVERVDLARQYDRVVVLDEGRVAETGTYQELMARPGPFRSWPSRPAWPRRRRRCNRWSATSRPCGTSRCSPGCRPPA
jgi:ABC-type multidrug transport system fused ATPase/permease subunit